MNTDSINVLVELGAMTMGAFFIWLVAGRR